MAIRFIDERGSPSGFLHNAIQRSEFSDDYSSHDVLLVLFAVYAAIVAQQKDRVLEKNAKLFNHAFLSDLRGRFADEALQRISQMCLIEIV